MKEIVDSVQRVTDIMAEITAASHEQSTGIEQVNQAIGQMDEVTQQNAALVEQAAAAAESMQDQAVSLAQVVSTFKLEDNLLPVRPGAKPASAQIVRPGTSQAQIRRPAVDRKKVASNAAMAGGDWEEF
jgi:uncharacterized phage infection (PIP) family protein YhgE